MTVDLVTIGVYGYNEEEFFDALVQAGVDTFCDIRARRGMRGKRYAFVNSAHLQAKLRELNIAYRYSKSLAPAQETRDLQKAIDKASKVAKSDRVRLSQSFIEDYQDRTLAALDPQQFLAELDSEAHVVALFCVESDPAACHRSLVAKKLTEELHLEIRHIGYDTGSDCC